MIKSPPFRASTLYHFHFYQKNTGNSYKITAKRGKIIYILNFFSHLSNHYGKCSKLPINVDNSLGHFILFTFNKLHW